MPRPSDLVPSGFFVLRTPLLPFDELLRWADDLEAPDAPDDADALDRDRRVLRARLRDFVTRPEVREAIFVASPGVHDLVDGWIANPDSERSRQCERALVRYFCRMTGRSTPFGLFAGVSTGRIGDVTNLALGPHSAYRRTTRLDAGYLVDVVEGLLAEPAFRDGLRYAPNPSLYRCGDRRRYVHSRPAADEDRHTLISVRDSDALADALAAAENGAGPGGIRATLVSRGRAEERVGKYVDDLIAQQVLVPDLDVQVTGADSTYGLADSVPRLAAVRERLAELDAEELGLSAARYREIASMLDELPAEVKPEQLFQVDMTKRSDGATLGADVVAEILRGAELVKRISRRDTGTTSLERFAERFESRYEGQRVSLLEALDPDLGVAFDDDESAKAPLLEGIGAKNDRPSSSWGPREDHLLARLQESVSAGRDELVLGREDLEKLEDRDAVRFPDAFGVMATVAARSASALAAGRFRVLVLSFDGPSGARLLGRFCHADPGLRAAVEEHLRTEEALDPDAVFAEIVHLPRARDVNVVARPVLREHEIACLGGPGAPPERQIPLADLLVSVEDGRIVLFSQRLDRRVVPRLTSAHNFRFRGMSVYRFLCALQDQSGWGGGYWGPLASAPFLPRVRSGRIIVSRAQWRLDAKLLDKSRSYEAVQRWREERGVPRFIALSDFGGQLPVDLDNVLAVESLAQTVRSREFVDLVECFPPPGELCVEGPEGAFAHELVVPFVRNAPARTRRTSPRDAPVRRRFAPGDEWLYARLYTGETIADAVLVDTVAPIVREVLDGGFADRWFFLRYQDPEFHLRLRFHGEPAVLREQVLPVIERGGQTLVDDGLVWRVELGTYQREAERYGGPEAIETVERAFHADSDAVVAILPLFEPGDAGLEERWQLGVVGVHRLLVDLGLDMQERFARVRDQRDGLLRRFRWDGAARGRVGARFRRERTSLERLVNAVPDEEHLLAPGVKILDERSARLAPVAERLRELEKADRLTRSRSEIASSLVHMHLNRLLRGNNTAQELVICDFLARLYEGAASRNV